MVQLNPGIEKYLTSCLYRKVAEGRMKTTTESSKNDAITMSGMNLVSWWLCTRIYAAFHCYCYSPFAPFAEIDAVNQTYDSELRVIIGSVVYDVLRRQWRHFIKTLGVDPTGDRFYPPWKHPHPRRYWLSTVDSRPRPTFISNIHLTSF